VETGSSPLVSFAGSSLWQKTLGKLNVTVHVVHFRGAAELILSAESSTDWSSKTTVALGYHTLWSSTDI